MGEMGNALQLPSEQLEGLPPAPTVVDEDEIEPTGPPSLEATLKDPVAKPDIAKDSPREDETEFGEIEQEKEEVVFPPTVQDMPAEPVSALPGSAPPVVRSKSRSRSSRILIAVVGLLIVTAIIAAGLIYINRKPPTVELSPIGHPQTPINSQTAQSVVSLGEWKLESHIEAIRYSPDGSLLGTANNRVVLPIAKYRFYSGLWHVATGALRRYFAGHSLWVYDVAFTPDSQLFGTASEDSTIFIWRVSDGEIIRTVDASFGGFTSLDFSPNNMLLAAGSWDGTVGLWQLDNGNLLRTLQANDESIRDIAFSPNGQLLAAAADDNTILLWQISDGSLVHTLEGHTDIIYRLAFSPDGTLLATGSEDFTIGLWQVDDGSLLRVLEGHTDSVYDVAFSQDGSLLASGSADGTLRLWQTKDGQMVNNLIEHWDHITSLAFSPDGHLLVSGAAEGTVNFWGISEAISPEGESAPDSP
jgi:hypothetical protein